MQQICLFRVQLLNQMGNRHGQISHRVSLCNFQSCWFHMTWQNFAFWNWLYKGIVANSYRFGIAWGWVHFFFFFEWTIPLIHRTFLSLSVQEACKIHACVGVCVWSALHCVCWDAAHIRRSWLGGADVLWAVLQFFPGTWNDAFIAWIANVISDLCKLRCICFSLDNPKIINSSLYFAYCIYINALHVFCMIYYWCYINVIKKEKEKHFYLQVTDNLHFF